MASSASVEPKPFVYNRGATDRQKRNHRKQTMEDDPESLYVTKKGGRDDKLMFYTEDYNIWKKALSEEDDLKNKIITHKFSLPEFTIMVYSTGICVIHCSPDRMDDATRKHEQIKKRKDMMAREQRPAREQQAPVEPKRFVYKRGATDKQKRNHRKKTMEDDPESLYVTEKGGIDDKLMFYTEDYNIWKKALSEEDDLKNKIITHKFSLPESTIMVYSTGICVIHCSPDRMDDATRKHEQIKHRIDMMAREL